MGTQAQERGQSIPCDLVIKTLDSSDIYNPNDPNVLFAEIVIDSLSEWKTLDTLMLKTITQLNVREDMYLVSGTIPPSDESAKEIYEWTISKAAVYYHSSDNTEFGISPDYYEILAVRRKKGVVEIKASGYWNSQPIQYDRRRKGRWYRFTIERIGRNCVALIRMN